MISFRVILPPASHIFCFPNCEFKYASEPSGQLKGKREERYVSF